MSAGSIELDFSNDIEYLERLSRGDESVETAEEIFRELENSESTNLLFNLGADSESESLDLTRDKYESTMRILRMQEEMRDSWVSRSSRYGLGEFGKIPGLIEDPLEKGYRDAEELEDFSTEKLEGIMTGEVEYSGGSGGRMLNLGVASTFGGLGALASEVFESISYSMQNVVNPENIQQAAQMTGEDMFTTGLGVAAVLYGTSAVHQSSFYQNGMEMRATDEYNDKKAEEIIEEYSDWEVI